MLTRFLVTALCYLSFSIQGLLAETVDGERVTNEVIVTFNIEDYHGTGEDKNVSIEVALFGEVAPMSVMNFIGLCKGYSKRGKILHYVGTPVHRVVPDFVIQMGDVTKKDGTSGHSIYGPSFDDEDFLMSHTSKGVLGMANSGKDTNGSQFYITLVRARWLDNSHVVFGKVIKGLDVVDEIGEIPASRVTAYPKKKIHIVECSEISLDRKWTMSEEQLYSNEDIKI